MFFFDNFCSAELLSLLTVINYELFFLYFNFLRIINRVKFTKLVASKYIYGKNLIYCYKT